MAILRSCVIALLLFLFVMCTSSRSQKQKLHILKRYSSKAQGVLTKEYSDPVTFKDLLKPILVPRMPDTDAIRAVQKHIVDILKKRNWHVELDTFQENTPYGVKTFTNIIATYNPLAPQKLVLAAHYDSKNITDRRYPNKQFIGATDSAVPCAILLDLAVQLDCLFQKGRGNKASDITPQLVFFDGEEAFKDWTDTDSIYGARHLAEKWSQPDPLDNSRTVLQSIKVFVLLDLIGTADIQFLNFFKKTSDLFEELVKIETELGKHNLLDSTGLLRKHRLFRSNENLAYPQGEGGGIEDDHIPFLRKGVPILHLISAPFPSVWHKMSDNGDAIDYQVTENFNRIFRVFVASYLHLDALYGSCRRKKKWKKRGWRWLSKRIHLKILLKNTTK